MVETRYNVVITVDCDTIGAEVHQRHVEEDVTFAQAMSEAKRQVEYIGADCVKRVSVEFDQLYFL